MNVLKQTLALLYVSVALLTPLAVPATVLAVEEAGGGAGDGTTLEPTELESDCKTADDTPLTSENCGIVRYIVIFTRVLSGLVGIVLVIMTAVAGLQYSMARDNPQMVSAAKKRMLNVVLALAVYIFGVAFLQYLVPGGIF